MRRYVERILVWMMVVMLVMNCMVLAEQEETAEPDSFSFEPTLANTIERSSLEWMQTSKNRALLSVLVSMDLVLDDQDEYLPDLSATSYVGRDSNILTIVLRIQDELLLEEEKSIVAMYDTNTREAAYLVIDDMSDFLMELFMDELCEDGWYENDTDEIYEVAAALQEAME